MPIGTGTAMLIGSGIAAAASGANIGFQAGTNKKARAQAEKWNQIQQSNWQQQFDYQKYLNENQAQIQAKDNALAGINPITGAGGSLQTYSGSTSAQQASVSAPQIDASGIIAGIQQYNQLKHDTEERAKDRESAERIAEINASASRYGSELGNEASHYGSDVQAAIAAENRRTQKQIADDNRAAQQTIASLDRASREKIAGWSNETQKTLQKAQQEWTDSDNHREAAKKLQQALEEAYDYGRELEAMKHLYITADTGEKYRLDDYLKMLEADARAYENSPTRRSENAIYRGLDRILNLFATVTGAATRR